MHILHMRTVRYKSLSSVSWCQELWTC